MFRWMVTLFIGLLMAVPCLAQQSFVGTYKLVSVTRIIDGKAQPMSEKPSHGYTIITPKYYIVFYTDGDRKYGSSEKEKAALWDSMTAFSGKYHIEGNKIIVSVDTSWNEVYNGTEQTRNYELQGNRLISSSAPRPWGRDPSKQLSYERNGRRWNEGRSFYSGARR